jgi:hypothetical protein
MSIYIAIAEIFNKEKQLISDKDNDEASPIVTAEESVSRLAYRIADYMAMDNPRLNKDRFLKACGVIEE